MENHQKNDDGVVGDGDAKVDTAQEMIRQLFQEFDYLGIGRKKPSQVPDNIHLLLSTFELINIYQRMLCELKTIKIEQANLKDENCSLKKKIDTLVNQKTDSKMQTNKLTKQLLLSKLECENYCIEKERSQRQLQHLYKNYIPIKGGPTLCPEEKIPNGASSVDSIHKYIMKYKENEKIYQETIRKLEDNNRGLLNEVLNLKEEIAMVFFNNQNLSSDLLA